MGAGGKITFYRVDKGNVQATIGKVSFELKIIENFKAFNDVIQKVKPAQRKVKGAHITNLSITYYTRCYIKVDPNSVVRVVKAHSIGFSYLANEILSRKQKYLKVVLLSFSEFAMV